MNIFPIFHVNFKITKVYKKIVKQFHACAITLPLDEVTYEDITMNSLGEYTSSSLSNRADSINFLDSLSPFVPMDHSSRQVL